uniref:Ketoreductase (KR) domain-containing protein n=1 Tax=Spongospora subterranea TaxID=70186 RepID=A0A0H5REI3_9EUKA|eukprot:CRZ11947.1 hypothetical protein [Spongospora subterranea]
MSGNSCKEGFSRDTSLRVVITGGSSGIGRSVVQEFAEAGHQVLFTYLKNKAGADSLIAKYPNNTHAVYCDQGNLECISNLYRQVKEWLNGSTLHALINNAALGSETVRTYDNVSPVLSKPVRKDDDLDIQDVLGRAWQDEALMRVNALGPLWITNSMIPLMVGPSRCVCIMIGSVGGSSCAVFPEYCPADLMSKAALGYLTRHLAAQHIYDHIDVLCVSPGATITDMFRKSTLDKIGAKVDDFIQKFPKRRLIEPEEIAAALLFLTTQSSCRIFHGSVIDASMGLSTRPGIQTEARR